MEGGSINSGSDCGWLDKVEFIPSGGYLITSQSGTLSGTGNSYTFSVMVHSYSGSGKWKCWGISGTKKQLFIFSSYFFRL